MEKAVKIVIVGAGYGGVLTAKKLAKKHRKHNTLEITLIDKNTYHTMLTELHEVVADRVPEQSIRMDLNTIFSGRPVKIIQDEILNVDTKGKVLESLTTRYAYDYLVLGSGSKPTFFRIPGAEEHCFRLWSYEDAVKLKEHILTQFRQASNEPSGKIRKDLLRFVVVGCGFTGIEMVGELGEWIPRLCRSFKIPPEDVSLHAVDFLPKVLPLFPEKLILKTEKRLKKLGVQIHTNTSVQEVGSDYAILSGIGTLKTQTVIWTAGIEGSSLAGSMPLKKEGRNRIVANEYLQSSEDPHVYVVGDNIFTVAGPDEKPVPQMVENAELSADLVAHNILASVESKPQKAYMPSFHGAMVSIGGRYGVAHIGMPGKFVALSGFPAMFVKHFINLVYFMQVAGFNKCWSYVKLEFFKVPDRRSFVGGHFSKASPNFWLVPLRVFMGFKWFLEGLGKLPQILQDPTNIFLIPPPANSVTGATTQSSILQPMTEGFHTLMMAPVSFLGGVGWANEASDAVSGATSAAIAAPVAQAVQASPGTVAPATAHMATSQFGQALPVPEFVTEITNKLMYIFFYTQDGGYTVLAQLFQAGIVLGEVVVGLCLIAGLFTFPASIAAILLCSVFWASGSSGHEMLWYFAASFATMGGSGSVFGLDYYVLPWLKSWWKRIPIIRKWYLFID